MNYLGNTEKNYFLFNRYSYKKINKISNVLYIGKKNSINIFYLFLSKKFLKLNEIRFIENESLENFDLKINKRYNLIMKAKTCNLFGIIILNPNIINFKNNFNLVKKALKLKNKKYFIFNINKLNEVKLKNFPEIECFIVLTCPYSNFYDYNEFYCNIINPIELFLALDILNLDHELLYDFNLNSLYNKLENYLTEYEKSENEEEERLNPKELVLLNDDKKLECLKNNKELVLKSMIQNYDYFENKVFKGLDKSIKKEVKKYENGDFGIAESYEKIKEKLN